MSGHSPVCTGAPGHASVSESSLKHDTNRVNGVGITAMFMHSVRAGM